MTLTEGEYDMVDDANRIEDEDTHRTATEVEARGGTPPPRSDSEEEEDVPRTATEVEARSAGGQGQTQTDDEEDTPRG
jgi:hypothetical protein